MNVPSNTADVFFFLILPKDLAMSKKPFKLLHAEAWDRSESLLALSYYSQTKWSVLVKINEVLMNWLPVFEYWTHKSFEECNNELIVVILNPLVVPSIQLMGLMLKKINLILIFVMTSKFNIQVINS